MADETVTPKVHYGDKVIPIDKRFDNLRKDITRLGWKIDGLGILLILHLLGVNFTASDILKFIKIAIGV